MYVTNKAFFCKKDILKNPIGSQRKIMLIDTHCHANLLVKEQFDIPLTPDQLDRAKIIIDQAATHGVTYIVNVGTSIVESQNCIELAKKYDTFFAVIGIHPNDLTSTWRDEFKTIEAWARRREENHLLGIGETGIDRHYPDHNLQRQKDAFKAHIELALEHDLALIVHTRDAYDETLQSLEEYHGQLSRGILHCFSEDQNFASHVLNMGFIIGIGGPITYPKNNELREIITALPADKFVLETDAPFLPPQAIRGKQNHPLQIANIAHYIAHLRNVSFDSLAQQTTNNACHVYKIDLEKLT